VGALAHRRREAPYDDTMLLPAVRRFLHAQAIAPCTILAAVSGGYDSTALLLALADLRADGFDVVAGHVNHHLRGSESDDDEQFVRELCASVDVRLFVADGTLDADAVKHRGVEAAAREVRTRCLLSMRDETNARYIATAHQKNDQAETVLMRLFSGSGLAGLRGIHAVREDGFIRPLLDITRAEVEAFLRERNVTPRVDRMNDDPRYLRTRIRRTLREYEPFVTANLAAVAAHAQQLWPEMQRAIDAVENVDTTADATTFHSLPDDRAMRAALLHRHIHRLDPHAREVSAADLARLADVVDEATRIDVTKELELVRRGGEVILRRKVAKAEGFEVGITAPGAALIGPGIEFRISDFGFRISDLAPDAIRNSKFEIRNSSLNLRQPFTLPPNTNPTFTVRTRRPHDRFHPLGSPHDKKLKDFLIDRKVPAEQRDRIPLLLHENQIVWIPGVEVSERFKVTAGAGEVWLATLNYEAK
jgi:tRNA(Ile)-lysidine synthase